MAYFSGQIAMANRFDTENGIWQQFSLVVIRLVQNLMNAQHGDTAPLQNESAQSVEYKTELKEANYTLG